ncbi:MAG: RDD family protein [Desulfatibacillaceae bacterium]|nr:RDD family protein [Desulfatibacillaceae bacterium]
MQTPRFKVVFSGVVYPGKKVSHVKRNLARLLEMDLEQIEALFETHGPVIRQSLDIATAISYAKVFEEAGAVCHVQAVSAKDDEQQAMPGQEGVGKAQESAPAAVAAPLGRSIKIFSAGPIAQDDRFAPLACPRFTGANGNLGINRLDREQIPFETVRALCVFGHQEAGEKKFTLFLFEKGQRRPLMVDTSKIVFNDFEGVKGQMLLASLRNFVGLVHQKNPNLIIDRPTYDFLSGQMPTIIKQDAHALATGIGKALEEEPALTAMPIPEQGILGALESAWLELLEKEQALPTPAEDKENAKEPAVKPFFKPEPKRVKEGIQGETVKVILARRPTAPLGRRILASVQSLLLMGCLILLLFIPADMFIRAEYSESIFQAFENKGTAWQAALSLIIGLPVALVFFVQVLLQKKNGQTWGQKLAGIQVIHEDQSQASGLDIWFVRFVGHIIMLMILGINALFVGFDARRISLADSFSQTRQVKTKFKPGILWQLMPFLLFMGLATNVFEYRARWESIPEGVMLWLIGVGMWLVTFFTYAAWRRGKDEIKTTG